MMPDNEMRSLIEDMYSHLHALLQYGQVSGDELDRDQLASAYRCAQTLYRKTREASLTEA